MAGYAAPATQGLASQQGGAFANNHTSSVFVKGLAKGVNERQLYALFSQVGTVVDCQVARHRSGRSAGFAVVQFARREDATRALFIMESTMLAGRRLNVRWYTPELQHSSMAGLGNISDLNKTLAAMLAPAQAAVPSISTASLGDVSSALAQQLLVQQLANALAAQQLSNNPLSGASYMPGSTGTETWTNTLDSTLSGLAAQHNGTPRGQHMLPNIPSMQEPGVLDIATHHQGSWGAGASDVGSHPLNAQLDSWARHSIDTSAPTYGPRRRSTQTGSRRSLEGSSLADCIVHANKADDQVDGGSKWFDSSFNRQASSLDISLPTCTPPDQSDDGSCSSRCRRGSSGTNPVISTTVALMSGALEQQDSTGAPKSSFPDDRSETNDEHYKQRPYSNRLSSASIQLPSSLDSDSLFAKPPVTSTPTKGLAPQPSGTPVIDRNIKAGGNANTGLRHSLSLSNASNTYMQAQADGRSPITRPAACPFPAAARPPAMPLFRGGDAGRLDLNATSNLSAGLGLDASPHVAPLGALSMEAAIQEARDVDTMIAHLTAKKAQALLNAYAAAAGTQVWQQQQQGPNGFPAQGTTQNVANLQSMGQLSAAPCLQGPGLGLLGSPSTMNGVAMSGSAAGPAGAAANLGTLMSAANMDLDSLTALVQLQQNIQNSVF